MVVTWLIDKSALVRLGETLDAPAWAERIAGGRVGIAAVTRLEVGFSARSGPALRAELSTAPLAAMPLVHATPAIELRALEVQALLADRGQHRAPAIPDLIVAATAELDGRAVLHVDKDFDLIAAVTGQPVERLALP